MTVWKWNFTAEEEKHEITLAKGAFAKEWTMTVDTDEYRLPIRPARREPFRLGDLPAFVDWTVKPPKLTVAGTEYPAAKG